MGVCYIYRELNTCADALANKECDPSFNLMFYERISAQISFLLLTDCIK